jgi:nitrite reductase/ring-hydroxylating ferredoxin subunit
MKWVKVLDTDGLHYPFIKKVNAGGSWICLVGVDEKIFALSAKCPHAGADISQGWCESGKLVCPYHRYSYDLQTGRGNAGQGDYIKIYPVEARADGIYVGVISFTDNLINFFKS